MPDIEKTIDRLFENYKSAVHAKDVDAFVRLYDQNVRVFDAWGIWSYEGLQAWRIAVESWFRSLGTERIKVAFEDVQTAGTQDFVVISAIVTYASLSPQGEQLSAMQNRLTWTLKTSGHVLRVVHEHTSVPVGFEDMKALLERKRDA